MTWTRDVDGNLVNLAAQCCLLLICDAERIQRDLDAAGEPFTEQRAADVSAWGVVASRDPARHVLARELTRAQAVALLDQWAGVVQAASPSPARVPR